MTSSFHLGDTHVADDCRLVDGIGFAHAKGVAQAISAARIARNLGLNVIKLRSLIIVSDHGTLSAYIVFEAPFASQDVG